MGNVARAAENLVPDIDSRVWVARIRAGDIDAFETVFRHLAPSLRVFVTRYVDSREVAEDLIQDLFLSIWRQREALELRATLTTYLYTAARNRALNYLKHERVVTRWQRDVPVSAESRPGIDEDVLEIELALAIQEAIGRLPTRARLMFLMSRQQRMTYVQIAQELGLSVKTVETQMGRALRALRLHLRGFLP